MSNTDNGPRQHLIGRPLRMAVTEELEQDMGIARVRAQVMQKMGAQVSLDCAGCASAKLRDQLRPDGARIFDAVCTAKSCTRAMHTQDGPMPGHAELKRKMEEEYQRKKKEELEKITAFREAMEKIEAGKKIAEDTAKALEEFERVKQRMGSSFFDLVKQKPRDPAADIPDVEGAGSW